jgi:hypothetical protein
VLAVALAAIATLAAVLPAVAAAPAAPKLLVSAGGARVTATAGARCRPVSTTDGAAAVKCTNDSYPLRTRGRVTLRPRKRVLLRFDRKVSSVQVRLLRTAAADARTVFSGRPGRDGRDRRRFVLRLPRPLPCAAVLDVFAVRGDGSDVDYWAAVRTPGRCKH